MSEEQKPQLQVQEAKQSQPIAQTILATIGTVNEKFNQLTSTYLQNDDKLRQQFNEKYNQGKLLTCQYWSQALKSLHCAKSQTQALVLPQIHKIQNEKDKLKNEFQTTYLRSGNLQERKNIIIYSSIGLFVVSFLMLKKGYIRYSFRNSAVLYLGASYVMCPENLNPF